MIFFVDTRSLSVIAMLVFVAQLCDPFEIGEQTHCINRLEPAIPATCPHRNVARYKGGEGEDENPEEDDERVRLWTAACLACHISYGTVTDGGANETLRLARSDGTPLADWIRIEQEHAQWCLCSGDAPGGGEILLLAWRGTVLHRLEDLVADLHCRQATAGNGLCAGGLHAGFLECADAFDYGMLARRCQAPGVRRVVLCGHSLGGAVAFLAAAMFARCESL